jgi:CRP-like cAMP-binding protein
LAILDMACQNRLLSLLPLSPDLAAQWSLVTLAPGTVLQRAGEAVDMVYFPIDCVISVLVTMDDGATTQVGVMGSRELVGLTSLMGVPHPTISSYRVSIGGQAICINADLLRAEFDAKLSFRNVLLRYAQFHVAQLAINVACASRHAIDQRLARWLLELRDRLGRRDLPVTHDHISQMLAVRRSTVSESLTNLAGRGLVIQTRGSIEVLHRKRLETASCECYAILRREFQSLLAKGTVTDL